VFPFLEPATIRFSEGSQTSMSTPHWPCCTSVGAVTASRTGPEVERATKGEVSFDSFYKHS
jgi:hypothetical protein